MQDVIFKTINSAKVLVVGDIILDQYIYGETNRISPEAPVPIVSNAIAAIRVVIFASDIVENAF